MLFLERVTIGWMEVESGRVGVGWVELGEEGTGESAGDEGGGGDRGEDERAGDEGGEGELGKVMLTGVDSAQGKDEGHGNSVTVVVGESMSQKVKKNWVGVNRGGDHAACSVGQT
ncbi:hypothetical protein F0562_035913 [Nyssa sinensis]|uniref:Uncharacterized protein n=1 Tax=Nyssa sinensis TaxID=561372 RepID=A0A5J5AED4_9ASTE|nr:hypothetical protein F0562_035913 [Nyssa sinensis]